MGILGIGTDILRINRIRLLMERRGPLLFAKRILSQREFDDFMRMPRPRQINEWTEDKRYIWLAGRFSAKESIFKAAYPTVTLTWKDVRIAREKGKPIAAIENTDLGKKLGKIHLTISHDGEYLSTVSVIEEPDEEGREGRRGQDEEPVEQPEQEEDEEPPQPSDMQSDIPM
ncbi:4'-phosphopantetheinyl transferase [Calocera viscosa TUFC12733]|uniref:4'-phosphopantetheinyl transferase n=1 Tax=Calocera viscosa (strain TUFC12733) TaxID=1330018 RepID=A0A167J4K9_CALVF|nr:4'-phosphopantetheinyl transferase [Calocera viscosa TUFC12733]